MAWPRAARGLQAQSPCGHPGTAKPRCPLAGDGRPQAGSPLEPHLRDAALGCETRGHKEPPMLSPRLSIASARPCLSFPPAASAQPHEASPAHVGTLNPPRAGGSGGASGDKWGGRGGKGVRANAGGGQVWPQPAPLPPPQFRDQQVWEGGTAKRLGQPHAGGTWAPLGEPAPSRGHCVPPPRHRQGRIPQAAPIPRHVPKQPGRGWRQASRGLGAGEGAHHRGLGHPRSCSHRRVPGHGAEKHPLGPATSEVSLAHGGQGQSRGRGNIKPWLGLVTVLPVPPARGRSRKHPQPRGHPGVLKGPVACAQQHPSPEPQPLCACGPRPQPPLGSQGWGHPPGGRRARA